MTQESDIKRWTAKRKAELIKQIYRGQTTVPEAELSSIWVDSWPKLRTRRACDIETIDLNNIATEIYVKTRPKRWA